MQQGENISTVCTTATITSMSQRSGSLKPISILHLALIDDIFCIFSCCPSTTATLLSNPTHISSCQCLIAAKRMKLQAIFRPPSTISRRARGCCLHTRQEVTRVICRIATTLLERCLRLWLPSMFLNTCKFMRSLFIYFYTDFTSWTWGSF